MSSHYANHHAIRQAVSRNDHGEAIRLGLEAIPPFDKNRREEMIRELERINCAHRDVGHLTPDLSTRRRGVYDHLMADAKAFLDADTFQEFNRIF